MTTPRTRSLVSLAAALTFTLALGGCASTASRLASDEPAPADAAVRFFRFDNDARDYVHVYLVSEKGQWLLGRVEPGARGMLRIPDAALAEDQGWMRLAVLMGEHMTLRAVGEPRAAITMAQPAAEILSRRWTFSPALVNGQLTAMPLGRARAEVGRQ